MTKYYKCRISTFSKNAYGGPGPITEVEHSEEDIIQFAKDDAKLNGESLESFAEIPWRENENGDPVYERELKGDELFRVAVSYLRGDGAIFDVEEVG